MAVDLNAERYPIKSMSDIQYWGDIVDLLTYDKGKFKNTNCKIKNPTSIRKPIHDQLIEEIKRIYDLNDSIKGSNLKDRRNLCINPNHESYDISLEQDLCGIMRFLIFAYSSKHLTNWNSKHLTNWNSKHYIKKSKISDVNTLESFKSLLEKLRDSENKISLHCMRIDFNIIKNVAVKMIEKTDEFINSYGKDLLICSHNWISKPCLKSKLELNNHFNFVRESMCSENREIYFKRILENKEVSNENYYILSFYFKKFVLNFKKFALKNVCLKSSTSELIENKVKKIAGNKKTNNLNKNLRWIDEISDSEEEVVTKKPSKRKIETRGVASEENTNNNKRPKILTHSEIKEKLESEKNPFKSTKEKLVQEDNQWNGFKIPKKIAAEDNSSIITNQNNAIDNNLEETNDLPRSSFILDEDQIIKEVTEDFLDAPMPKFNKYIKPLNVFVNHDENSSEFEDVSDTELDFDTNPDELSESNEFIDLTVNDTDYEKYLQKMSEKANTYKLNKSNQSGQNPGITLNLTVNNYYIQINNNAQ